jgi:hypothetical protein
MRRCFLVVIVLFGCTYLSSVQQPKVPAPHDQSIPPRLPFNGKWHKPPVPRSMVGGLWMIDANFKSLIYLTNNVENAPITVTPVLYLSNGQKYVLKEVILEPSGTAVVNINEGLRDQGVAPWATLVGYVEIQYQWPWDALCVEVVSTDVVHSLIFSYGLRPSLPVTSGAGPTNPAAETQVLEGMWWRQEPGVTGFVALSNLLGQPMDVKLEVSDSVGVARETHLTTISPHGTKVVNLSELSSLNATEGGVRIHYNGPEYALAVNGGLEDQSTGYSAIMPFRFTPASSTKIQQLEYAAVGLMTGPADPMMSFPADTVFTPYAMLRNISGKPLPVTPTFWWMEAGTARSASLPALTLAPYQTQTLNLKALLTTSGLANFNGSFNLVLDTVSPLGGLLIKSGSVDQKYTYVFEVAEQGVGVSITKPISYWSTAHGDDSMVSLWNPADEAQDLVFTLFFSGGHYQLPLHLGPRASLNFNVSEIIHNQIPDAEGNIIPATVYEGSAEISGPRDEIEHILVAVNSGTYNVQKATCHLVCTQCTAPTEDAWIDPNPIDTPVGDSVQSAFNVQINSGPVYDFTSTSKWSSSQTSIATVSGGLVKGISSGQVTITALSNAQYSITGQVCAYGIPPACPTIPVSASVPAPVQVPTSLALNMGSEKTYNGTTVTDCAGNVIGTRWGYSRCAAYTILDQYGNPIKTGNYMANESFQTVSSNPPGIPNHNGSANPVGGVFSDFLAFLAKSPPAPQPGEYIKQIQTITIHDNNNGTNYPVRSNCLDFEYNDVTDTDITHGGSCK